MNNMHSRHFKTQGFTLVEVIVVIVITGIIAGMVAVFIRAPVEGYVDAERRAGLTDIADTAVRRMTRDIRLALPNSVRNPVDGSDQCVEFMPTKIGARYRAVVDGASGNGDALDFTEVDNAFDMLWPNAGLPAASQIQIGDVVVVYNDGSAAGDAYSGANAIQVAALGAGGTANSTAVSFVGAAVSFPFNRKQLPGESPGARFQVIPGATHVVSYFCNGTNLTRHTRVLSGAWGRPANCAAMVAGSATAVLTSNLGACSLVYDPPGVSTGLSRFGLVSVTLGITDVPSGETVNIYHQVHVDNTP